MLGNLLDPDRKPQTIVFQANMLTSPPPASTAHPRGREKRGRQSEALDRSQGGLRTKIHLSTAAATGPVAFILAGGEVADVTRAEPPADAHQADDRGCLSLILLVKVPNNSLIRLTTLDRSSHLAIGDPFRISVSFFSREK